MTVWSVYQQQFTNSQIFTTKDQKASMIQYVGTNSQWRLCYSGVVHGWASTTFHSNCDNQGLFCTSYETQAIY